MMSDTTPPNEVSFVLAAEKAIEDLRFQAGEAATAATAAKKAAGRAETSARRWRRLTVVLGLVVTLSLALSGLGAYLWLQQKSATSQLRQQAITSCQIGNDRATGTVASMDQLITVLEGPAPKDNIKVIARNLEAYILAHNQQRNCPQAYTP